MLDSCFDNLFLRLKSLNYYSFNFLAMVKNGLQSVGKLQVSIQDRPKYLHGLLVRDTSHQIVHVVHELFNLDNDLMARLSLRSGDILHLLQLVRVESELNCLEHLGGGTFLSTVHQEVSDHVQGHGHDLLDELLGHEGGVRLLLFME